MAEPVLLTCPDLGLPLVHRGKVREVFDLGDRLLMVATDRLSAFDVVFPTGIPGKGRVLTQLSALWFRATRHLAPNHLITTDLEGIGLRPEHAALLAGRAMVVRKARRVDVEAVVRGYLAGSGWKEYQRTGAVCGVPLPPGLKMNARLPEPIFTPALKRDQGHDENITFGEMVGRFGRELSEAIREISLRLYTFAAERAARAGIILADTKFEFGLVDGQLILIDELFTPDSSRYWPADQYREGEPIDSLDKQPIRDWAEASGWNKEPPAPELPPELVAETAQRYAEVLERLQAVLAE